MGRRIRGGRQKPREAGRNEKGIMGAQPGFMAPSDRDLMACPDCLDTELTVPTMPRSKKVESVTRPRMAKTCETCKGFRYIPRPKKERHDPYRTPLAQHS